jgi:hypothetical protein
VLGKELFVDARPVVETLQIALCDELAEIPLSLLVLDEQRDVKMKRTAWIRDLFMTAFRRYIDFTADDGLDILFPGLLEKGDRAEDVSVVGESHSRHPVFIRGIHEVFCLESTIQDAEFRVIVQMDECGFHFYCPIPNIRELRLPGLKDSRIK